MAPRRASFLHFLSIRAVFDAWFDVALTRPPSSLLDALAATSSDQRNHCDFAMSTRGQAMKALVISAAVIVAGSGSVLAQTAPPSWQGSMTITALTGASCDTLDGLGVGSIGVAIYKPKLPGDNLPAAVQFVWSRAASIYRGAGNQLNGSGAYTATRLGTRAISKNFGGNYSLVTVPTTVVANTRDVKMWGGLTNFQQRAGCTASIRAQFTKRPAGEP